MGTKRTFKFTLSDISAETGKSIHSVRDDRRKGKFNPEDIKSFSLYVTANLMLKDIEEKS